MTGDILLLLLIIFGVVVFGLYYLNRMASKKLSDQNNAIERMRQTVSMYVIDKKKAKVKDANLPKIVMEKMPKIYKLLKMPLVKGKVGPQIMTFMCDKKVFEALPVKKTVKVDIAGIYIVDMKGLKSDKEYKANKKEKGEKASLSLLDKAKDKFKKKS